MSIAGQQASRFAGKVLKEFLDVAAAKAGEATLNYLTKPKETPQAGGTMSQADVDRIFGGKASSDRVPRFTNEKADPVTKFITENPERTAKYVEKFTPAAAATAGAALLAGGTALVRGIAPGEKPRSDYYVGMGSPIDQMAMRQQGAFDQLAMRQMGAAESIEQKLMADLVRTQAHAALADRKFEHQMALQQHRQDAMTPRNQPMAGGGDLNYVMNTANRIFGATPSY